MSQLQINSCGCLLRKTLHYVIIYNEIEYVSEVFMNTDHLKYFVLVADSLNITNTAKELFISQQALSNHINNLEDKLGVKLFERSPNLSLTYAGKRVYRLARQILDTEEQMHREIEEMKGEEKGEIRIGISHTRGRVVLPDIIPEFSRRYPLVDIKLVEGNSADLEKAIMSDSVDIIVQTTPINPDLIFETIRKERLYWVIPNKFLREIYGDNFRKIQEVDIKRFSLFPFVMMTKSNTIRHVIDDFFAKIGLQANIRMEVENIETVLSLAHKELGITVYPEMFLNHLSPMFKHDDKASYFPIKEVGTEPVLVAAYRRGKYLNKFHREFIDICKQTYDTENRMWR